MWKSPIWYNTTGKSVLEVQESAKKTNEKRKKNSKRECQACNLRQQRSAKEEENSTGSSISGCVGGSLVRRRMDRGRGRRMGNFVRWVAEASKAQQRQAARRMRKGAEWGGGSRVAAS